MVYCYIIGVIGTHKHLAYYKKAYIKPQLVINTLAYYKNVQLNPTLFKAYLRLNSWSQIRFRKVKVVPQTFGKREQVQTLDFYKKFTLYRRNSFEKRVLVKKTL